MWDASAVGIDTPRDLLTWEIEIVFEKTRRRCEHESNGSGFLVQAAERGAKG